jgi:negative regulator of sigma E activity
VDGHQVVVVGEVPAVTVEMMARSIENRQDGAND